MVKTIIIAILFIVCVLIFLKPELFGISPMSPADLL